MREVKTVAGVPIEAGRAAIEPDAVHDWFRLLEAAIPGIPQAFVFTTDETGCSDWADRPREVRVVMPSDVAEVRLPVPFDRHSKRASMTVCIAADDSHTKPFIVIHRASVERELCSCGYCAVTVLIDKQPNLFMMQALFTEWANQVFSQRSPKSASSSATKAELSDCRMASVTI
jgi:hypothetical protein